MSLNCTQGFIVNEIKTRRIKAEDTKNGILDGNEFIKSGLNSVKLFQAFKGISGDSYNEKFGNNIFKGKKEAVNFGKSENSEQIKSFLQPQKTITTQNMKPVKRTTPVQTQKVKGKTKSEPFKEMGKSLFDFIKNSQYSLNHPNISGSGHVAKRMDFLA